MSMRALLEVQENLSNVVQCDLINSTDRPFTKLETCTVNLLCQWQVKHCTVKIFVLECNISMKVTSGHMCLYEHSACSDVKNS